MIDIDKDIPIPQRKTRKSKYPFPYLEIGESFLMEGSSNGFAQSRIAYIKKTGCPYKFTTRTVEGGVRVWRIA